MTRTFTEKDGVNPADLVHCALDHLSASEELFKGTPNLFDSAGYLAHIGIEMLLKGWLLETNKSFKGTHNLQDLYDNLVEIGAAKELEAEEKEILVKLDGYEQLRYPNINSPTEVGDEDSASINKLISKLCNAMPPTIEEALSKINPSDKHEPVKKSGRVLMKKRKEI